MNDLDARTALDNLLVACHAILPGVDDYENFSRDRTAASVALTSVKAELIKAQSAVAQARFELDAAQGQLQTVKDETVWALKDLGRIRQELDELVRQRARRG